MRKKNKIEEKKPLDYTIWEKDLGFLSFILSRKKGITKEFLVNTYNKQKATNDYITDEELEPIISSIITETLEQIGDNYKNFLIEKYFGNEENLIAFITEDVYVDLIADSINRNTQKITTNLQKKVVSAISNMNRPNN